MYWKGTITRENIKLFAGVSLYKSEKIMAEFMSVESSVVVWATKHWVASTLLAMGVGLVVIIRGWAGGESWPVKRVLSRALGSLVGGVALVLAALGFGLNEWFVYLSAMVGGFMGMSVLEVGEEVLKAKGKKQ